MGQELKKLKDRLIVSWSILIVCGVTTAFSLVGTVSSHALLKNYKQQAKGKADTIKMQSDTLRMLKDKQARLFVEVFTLNSLLKECENKEAMRKKKPNQVLQDITEWNKKHQK
jgi:hypothetical protein